MSNILFLGKINQEIAHGKIPLAWRKMYDSYRLGALIRFTVLDQIDHKQNKAATTHHVQEKERRSRYSPQETYVTVGVRCPFKEGRSSFVLNVSCSPS